MTRMPKEELEKIIEQDAPGYTLATPSEGLDERAASPEPEETSPDIDELRRKYLGEPEVEASGNPAPEDAPAVDDDGDEMEDQIVAVRPAEPIDPFDHAARPKTVVVSGKDKRIVGQQG